MPNKPSLQTRWLLPYLVFLPILSVTLAKDPHLGLLLAVTLIGVIGLHLLLARRLANLLDETRARLEETSPDDPVPIHSDRCDSRETETLLNTLSEMLDRNATRFRDMTRQRDDLITVLTSMIEGVIVVDIEGRILRINRAAGTLIGLHAENTAVGRRIRELAAHSDLEAFVALVLSEQRPLEKEIVLKSDGEEHVLQANGTIMRDTQGRRVGAVVVLNEVTRLKRLETVRREFVANVSHELKTPITSIKGFVETLRDGAIHDHDNAISFLDIVSRQADRLNSIIEDLLSLSRLEQDSERNPIALEEGLLSGVIDNAFQVCANQAEQKKIRLIREGDDKIRLKMNAPLLEQALVNLIDNAIKYSEPARSVTLRVERPNGRLYLHVIDQGCGIPLADQPRIFERFYRVDKARSRKQGGTGLGLAICKHIVLAHGGAISVSSQPGHGSVFTIQFP